MIQKDQCQQNYRMTKKDIKVPNIGEFKNVEVIEVLVKKGQEIKKNDPLITIESDKSSVEIPSSLDGKVISLNVKIGDKVSEGDKILELEISKVLEKKTEIIKTNNDDKKVVYHTPTFENNNKESNLIKKDFSFKVSASPKARKFARELGVDINQVKGTERGGRIIESDIKYFVSSRSNNNFKGEDKKLIKWS